jgi:peptidoglycan/xylan/chitin deacetylase (PgdA/CDA1 family)
VLGYHRVLERAVDDVTSCPPGMVVSRPMFERQIAWAARQYRMLDLDEILESCDRGRPLPARAGLVTFDDGWRDNYTVAYPILRRMGVPAAVFVTTDFIGTRRAFWFTPLMESLLQGKGRGLQPGDGRAAGWPAELAEELDRLASGPKPLRAGHLTPLVEALKRHPEARIEEMVSRLGTRLNGCGAANSPEAHFLTWDEVRELDRHGMRAGSHTCSHRILTQLSDGEARQELRHSRQRLEQELGREVASIAFPNGDYFPAHMAAAHEAGYRLFFVSTRVHPGGPAGRVFPRPCVEDRVGRGPFGGFSPGLMEFHLAGVWDRLRGRA